MKQIFTLILIFLSFKTFALDETHFTVTRISAPYFIADASGRATMTQGHIGFEVKNISSVTYSKLRLSIISIEASVTGQAYSVSSPTDGIVNIGTLAPGESRVCYYYVTYPGDVTAQGTFNLALSDNTARQKTLSTVIANRSSVSANASGTSTQTIINQNQIGGTLTADVTYNVGPARPGYENDFQVAVSAQFDSRKLILIESKVISSSVPGIPAGATDSLYFVGTARADAASVTIRWTFRIAAYNFTTRLLPSAGVTNAGAYKYSLNSDLGTGTAVTVSSPNPLVITKTSDRPLYGPNTPAIFTITFQNTGSYGITLDKIRDELPAGFSFQSIDAASQVNDVNSVATPRPGSTGQIYFEAGNTSGNNLSYYVPAGGIMTLKYTAITSMTTAANLHTSVGNYVANTLVSSADNVVSVSTTLPVHFISFKGSRNDEKVMLNWVTAQEMNIGAFEVQRRNGNGDFITIGQVAPSGTPDSRASYSFVDGSAPAGTNHYRIKEVDIDGRYEFSNIVSILPNRSIKTAKTFPNPFTNYTNVTISSAKAQSVRLLLSDVSGKTVWVKNENCVKGTNTILLDQTNHLKPGTYFLRIITEEGSYQEEIIKN